MQEAPSHKEATTQNTSLAPPLSTVMTQPPTTTQVSNSQQSTNDLTKVTASELEVASWLAETANNSALSTATTTTSKRKNDAEDSVEDSVLSNLSLSTTVNNQSNKKAKSEINSEIVPKSSSSLPLLDLPQSGASSSAIGSETLLSQDSTTSRPQQTQFLSQNYQRIVNNASQLIRKPSETTVHLGMNISPTSTQPQIGSAINGNPAVLNVPNVQIPSSTTAEPWAVAAPAHIAISGQVGTQDGPRQQRVRFAGDVYTPQWVRFTGHQKEGYCDQCPEPGRWLQLKNSAYWYHKQFYHGISSISGNYFSEPMDIRVVAITPAQSTYSEVPAPTVMVEGLCHFCCKWTPLMNPKKRFSSSSVTSSFPTTKNVVTEYDNATGSSKEIPQRQAGVHFVLPASIGSVPEVVLQEINDIINLKGMVVLWFRHAHKCHVYHKPKSSALAEIDQKPMQSLPQQQTYVQNPTQYSSNSNQAQQPMHKNTEIYQFTDNTLTHPYQPSFQYADNSAQNNSGFSLLGPTNIQSDPTTYSNVVRQTPMQTPQLTALQPHQAPHNTNNIHIPLQNPAMQQLSQDANPTNYDFFRVPDRNLFANSNLQIQAVPVHQQQTQLHTRTIPQIQVGSVGTNTFSQYGGTSLTNTQNHPVYFEQPQQQPGQHGIIQQQTFSMGGTGQMQMQQTVPVLQYQSYSPSIRQQPTTTNFYQSQAQHQQQTSQQILQTNTGGIIGDHGLNTLTPTLKPMAPRLYSGGIGQTQIEYSQFAGQSQQQTNQQQPQTAIDYTGYSNQTLPPLNIDNGAQGYSYQLRRD